ncbi:MAG: ABC transporter substrate-binding protein [Dehalococcoidales bacterium]|nr:MAG: ABC transporter substrate-binding protein [Dehalococcoidales bacterium]
MMKKIGWMVLSCVMVLSLVLVSCESEDTGGTVTQEDKGQTVTVGGEEEKTDEKEEIVMSSDKPQYGGSITLSMARDVNDFLPWSLAPSPPVQMCNDWLWNGDWAKGNAGGYGTADVGWETSTNLRDMKAYYLAEDIRWEANDDGETGTVYIKVKEGIHYSLDPTNPVSQLVGGREVTADDVLWNFNMRMNDSRSHPGAYIYLFFPWMHGIYGEKVGPNEISFTFPVGRLLDGIMFLCDGTQIFPPEIDEEYQAESTTDWQACVGAGPFMIEDYVPSNITTVKRNPNYWGKNPIGPGEGDQLPYLDKIKYLLIEDASTQQAAFRTGNLAQIGALSIEDKNMMVRASPEIIEAVGGLSAQPLLGMRTDLPGTPYADVRVRKAMMMATDFNEINEGLYQGLGQILTWPYWYQKGYEDLYLSLDDPDCPAEIKELYTYNPEKAKELLSQAGYPGGFKGEVLMTETSVDYYSIIKDQWAKVGIELVFNVQEFGAYWGILNSYSYEEMVVAGIPPPSSWPEVAGYTGITSSNFSKIDDEWVNEAADHMRTTAITDLKAAMRETREIAKYLLPGAWVIPTPRYPTYTLWWSWMKNYSGENSVGWLAFNWSKWVWVDQDMKDTMGH